MKKFLILSFAIGGALPLHPLLAADGNELYKTKGCSACHAIDTKTLGPSYKDVAAKYASQADAAAMLAAKIKSGGSGTWGKIPMPPSAVTDEEARTLAVWVLTQK
ncbi:c-type cytochrome [Azotobacter beijerinckii]|uniref:c-type cytochrome n=1 Tax=Azotobacter beijerinckii TaxID=170623 RepID=UPI002952B75C|nr:c-type cytochrome [Azotobacter beijerinckii]MDV7212944.1 c-type cytochrome [Azotobacter beijerinckii]